MSPFIIAIIVLVLLSAAFLKLKNRVASPPDVPGAQNEAVARDVGSLIQKVARHIVVKDSETPSVATVQDADALRSQNPIFYKDAQNGDRVLVWSDKVVLYSVTKDVLLAVLPISIPVPAPTASTSTSTTPGEEAATSTVETATIEVRNGSGTTGRGRTLATQLKQEGFTVLPATDANRKDYAKTVIYIASDKPLSQTLNALVKLLNAEVVTTLPDEASLKGDIVIVVGADDTP